MENVKIITGNIEITFHAAGGCDGYSGFGDQWKMVDDHKGGVTIKNPQADRNSYAYAVPQQTTFAELASYYAGQGRANPSSEVYESLQSQLVRDIDAADYYITASAKHIGSGVILLSDFDLGHGFDYSYHDDQSLEEALADQIEQSDAVTLVKEEIQRIKEIYSNI